MTSYRAHSHRNDRPRRTPAALVQSARSRLGRLHLRNLKGSIRWLAAIARAILRRRAEQRPTIAIDITPLWRPLTGVGWYLDRLLAELAPRTDLLLRLYGPTLAAEEAVPDPPVPPPQGPAIEWVLYPTPNDTLVHPDRLIRTLRRLERWLIAADRNRVIFAPNFYPPSRFEPALGLTEARLVATVHDLAFRSFPWTLDEGTLDLLSRNLDRTLIEAARIVTPSEAIRRELCREGLAPPERVRAIYHGPGQLAAAGASGGSRRPHWAPERFGLFVGTLEPRKNIETLLKAWSRLRRRRPDAPALVVCGKVGWKDERLRRELERGQAEGWLHHPGYVANEELAGLYRGALLLAFPSHYEGFGLPVLEALVAGTPVVASDIPVLREVAADAALYAPPDRPDLWTERIEDLLEDEDLARSLRERGPERARRFTWKRSAHEHVEVFREAVGTGWRRRPASTPTPGTFPGTAGPRSGR